MAIPISLTADSMALDSVHDQPSAAKVKKPNCVECTDTISNAATCENVAIRFRKSATGAK